MVRRKIIVEGAIYHITQRAPGRELLFIEENDYLKFLQLLKETSQKFAIEIFCFALLPNHIHLLLRLKNRNLDKAMQYLFQRYAQIFNIKYERKGHVFCGVYRASMCQDDSYFLTASLYIHLNPYKAGLTPSILKYKWFSLKPYIEPIKSSFLKVDFILDMLDNRDRNKAQEIYKMLLKQSTQFKYRNILEDKNAIQRFYGEFLIWFKSNLSKVNLRYLGGFNSYLELEKKIEEIRQTKRFRKPETREAVFYLIAQLEARGYSLQDIAKRLGLGRTTIYRFLNKMEQ